MTTKEDLDAEEDLVAAAASSPGITGVSSAVMVPHPDPDEVERTRKKALDRQKAREAADNEAKELTLNHEDKSEPNRFGDGEGEPPATPNHSGRRRTAPSIAPVAPYKPMTMEVFTCIIWVSVRGHKINHTTSKRKHVSAHAYDAKAPCLARSKR